MALPQKPTSMTCISALRGRANQHTKNVLLNWLLSKFQPIACQVALKIHVSAFKGAFYFECYIYALLKKPK